MRKLVCIIACLVCFAAAPAYACHVTPKSVCETDYDNFRSWKICNDENSNYDVQWSLQNSGQSGWVYVPKRSCVSVRTVAISDENKLKAQVYHYGWRGTLYATSKYHGDERDCKGICGGSNVVDACGVCGGNGPGPCGCDSSIIDLGCGCGLPGPSGCDNQCGSTKVDLGCGCGLPGPSGCDNQCFSNKQFDQCGVCGGDNSTCKDCMGVPNGNATYDLCGVCGGDNSTCKDCLGVPNGDATIDVCGVCDGDGTSCLDCEGVPNGDTTYDECGVCGGDNSTCKDCLGVPNGKAEIDVCGVCAGDGTSCLDCLGVPNGDAVVDECGICDGDNSTCAGCDGIPNSGKVYDKCGVCGGDGSSCECTWLDECGVPCGDNSTCKDCAGVPNGSSYTDQCGVCDADPTNDDLCLDCNGVPNGGAIVDACGVCDGPGGKIIEFKKRKKTLRRLAHFLFNKKVVKYNKVAIKCNADFTPVAKRQIKKARKTFKTFITVMKELKLRVEVCPDQCSLFDNKKIIKKLRRLNKKLYSHASDAQHLARASCKNTGPGKTDTQDASKKLDDQIKRCPSGNICD